MNELINEIECQLSDLKEFKKEDSLSFPLDSLTSKTPMFMNLVNTISPILNGNGNSKGGLMWVDTKGGNLFRKRDTGKFIGNIANKDGTVGGGLAELTPINFNPETLIVAAATASITQKLDEIKEVQMEMFDFLKIVDESKLVGDLNFLVDVFSKITVNYDDQNFLDSIKNQLNEISRLAFENVEKYKNMISKELDKKQFIHFQGDVKKKIEEIRNHLSRFQLSIYMHALSQYLLIRVNKSTKKEYLEQVANTIEKFSLDYRDSYTNAYNSIEDYSKNSGEQLLLTGVSALEKFAGQLMNKMPGLKDRNIGNKVIEQSEKAKQLKSDMKNKSLSVLLDKQKAQVMPYIENIRLMSHVYNDDVQIGLDKDNLYIANILN